MQRYKKKPVRLTILAFLGARHFFCNFASLNVIFNILGVLCVVIAVIGIVLPLLPTTPFLLLAAWCFFKGSPRLYQALLGHPKLGPYIVQYREHRAIPKGAQKRAIIILWSGLNLSAILWIHLGYLPLILITVGIAVSAHISSFKTVD